MIKLSNGYQFQLAAASGSLGFDGNDAGHGGARLWKMPFRWSGHINPVRDKMLVITKSLTMTPTPGALRWWCPWRAVRLVPGGTVNAVKLTNPGIKYWLQHYCRRMTDKYDTCVSIWPRTVGEAEVMSRMLANVPHLRAIEISAGCPNVPRQIVDTPETTTATTIQSALKAHAAFVIEIVRAVRDYARVPLILKLGLFDWFEHIICELIEQVEVFDCFNAVPWDIVYPGYHSPLAPYGADGAVSGDPISKMCRHGAHTVRKLLNKLGRGWLLAGGGITDRISAYDRIENGADALSLGTVFLRTPWRIPSIVRAANHCFQERHPCL